MLLDRHRPTHPGQGGASPDDPALTEYWAKRRQRRGGATLWRLREEHGFFPGGVDLVFIDHAKKEYVPDLERILDEGWLHPGSVVVADNVKFPGAPEYRAYMHARDGTGWRTTEHSTHAEYQSLVRDLVLESEYLQGTSS
jgi:catechol O-methyltransferase